jgi:hypothetical protein
MLKELYETAAPAPAPALERTRIVCALKASAAERLAFVLVLLAFLWGGVYWALH